MSSELSFYLLHPFHTIPVDRHPGEWLGRIVKSYSDPRANFTPAAGYSVSSSGTIDDDPGFLNVEQLIHSASSKSLRLSLADMLSLGHSYDKTNSPSFQSRKIRRLKLLQEDDFRQRSLALDDVKVKLKDWHKLKQPVYMIVGVLIADQVRYAEEEHQGRQNEMEVKPPSEIASLSIGSPIPIPNPGEVGISGSRDFKRAVKLTATGSRIFAVEYRVLTKRLLSTSGKIDVRPGGIRGDRAFGHEEDKMGSPTGEEQQVEIFPDPDPLSEVVEESDAEEYSFTVDL